MMRYMDTSSYIIDSALSDAEILLENPAFPAPREIVAAIQVCEVVYVGYDGKMHQGQIAVHSAIAHEVEDFFALARELSFPIEKVIPISDKKYAWDDETSCTDNNSSGYNYRTIMGTDRLSKHARGCAFDINPAQNIYIRYDEEGNEIFRSPKNGVYDETVPGTLTANHPLVLAMKAKGWVWGGDWTKEEGRVDYQHFEKDVL